MTKLKETLSTLSKAFLYSFRFCWRNSRTATLVRLAFSAITPLIAYLVFLTSGMVFNAVQKTYGTFDRQNAVSSILHSGVYLPIVLLVGIILLSSVLGQIHWFYRNYWNQSLRFANLHEVNSLCSSLDVTTFQSKEFDTITRRIDELPNGRMTRIVFADEAFVLFSTTVSFFFFGVSLLWFEPVYALILVATSLPMIFVSFNLTSLWWNLYESLVPHHKRRHVLVRAFQEDVGFAQASMFNQHETLEKQIVSNSDHVIGLYDVIRRTCVRKELVTNALMVLGLGTVLVWAVYDTLVSGGKIGTLTIIYGSARTFQGNLEQIVSLLADQWNSAKGVILIQDELLSMKSRIITQDPIVPSFTNPDIRFDRVTYSYPDQSKPALSEATFDIRHGESVAIVGENGAGKSTIIEMLLRRRDPDTGSVYFSGINARNIEPKLLREYVSALTQRHKIFERLISDEIASSRLSDPVDLERVQEVSRISRFDCVVAKCDDAYSTQIGTAFGGKDFSGGESQRLAIARMLYRNTPIIILDEPEASLDKETSEHLINALLEMKDKTVILVTHNIVRAERCDKVIVMAGGSVAEQGSPSELKALGGKYSLLASGKKPKAEEAEA